MATKKVLYLEDSEFDVMVARNALSHLCLDLELHVTATEQDFSAALANETFDLVISDGSVPGCQGHEAMWLAQRYQPGVPFIFFSGHHNEAVAEASMAAGALDFIDKRDLWRLKRQVWRVLDPVHGDEALEALHRHARRQQRLVEAVKALSLARTLDDVTAVVRSAARDLVMADGATFILRDGDQCHYVDEDALSPLWRGKRFPMSACISGWAMLNRAQVAIPDIYADSRIPHDAYRLTFVRSLVMTPVRQSDPIAAIGAYWANQYHADESECELLQSLADAAAMALENVRLYADLEQRVVARTARLSNINRELEAVAYSISHDLRAPLRAINGFGNILFEDYLSSLPEEGRHYLLRICAEAARMNDQLDDLLRLFRLSAQPVEPGEVDLATVGAEVVERLRTRDPGRHVALTFDPKMTVRADAGLVSLLLENLLGNAWKYTSQRQDAQIRLGWEMVEGEQTFFVRDNGAGFDMNRASMLFVPFQRFHSERDFPGTGVGLAVAQRIVHRHGGRIWADSTPGEGATFYFTLPDDA